MRRNHGKVPVPCRRTVVAISIAAAVLLAACGQNANSSGTSITKASVSLSPRSTTTLHLGNGLSVTVPVHSVQGTGNLTGSEVSAPSPAPTDYFNDGPTYRLEITGTTLDGPVTLKVPVPPASGPNDALLAYFDTTTATWIPVPANYNAQTGILTAISRHLSIWSVLRVDSGKVLNAVKSSLEGFLGITTSAAQPSCPNSSDLATDGTKVNSDSGDLVKWCAGATPQVSPLLVTANNRNYMVESDYPTSWPMHRTESPSLADDVVAAVARLMSQAYKGQSAVIIPGGESVEYDPPSGSSGEVQTHPSPGAYLADAFAYGLQTLAMTFDEIPGGPKANPSDSGKAFELAINSATCASTLDKLARGSVSDASSAGGLFRNDVDLATGCLGSAWKDAYGISGFLASFWVSFVLWLVDGIKLVVQGLQEAIDSMIYWRSYRIALSSTVPPTLGQVWDSGQQGYGEVAPSTIFNGGDPMGLVGNVVWQSWGGAQAIGHGTSDYVAPGVIVADGTLETATVVAFDLGSCNGKQEYQAIEWYYPQHGESFDTNNYINICTGNYVGPENNPSSTTTPTATASNNGLWTDSALTITPNSLGAVQIGMSLSQAQQSAGVNFDGAGDGFSYPTTLPAGYPHLYVGGQTVDCVGAGSIDPTPTQTVSTPEGFVLGGSVQSLLSIYGSRAAYEPAPTSGGMTDNAGYVVAENSGDLVFVVGLNGTTISEIAGGQSIGPNSCTG